jgi:broad-specificity NMP kinase
MLAVVLTGPPGAGKTSVLTALVDDLSDSGVPHAAIEVEMLVWTHPAVTEERWARHVETACALHRDAGHDLLLVAQTAENDDELARLLTAVGAEEHVVVRLEAEPDTLAARIVEREPESWSGLAELVEHSRELSVTMPALRGVDLVLSTEGERPEAVAARIRERIDEFAASRWSEPV